MKHLRPIQPCARDCKDRTADCHGSCEKYSEFRRKLDIYNEIERGYMATSFPNGGEWSRGSDTLRAYRKAKKEN